MKNIVWQIKSDVAKSRTPLPSILEAQPDRRGRIASFGDNELSILAPKDAAANAKTLAEPLPSILKHKNLAKNEIS